MAYIITSLLILLSMMIYNIYLINGGMNELQSYHYQNAKGFHELLKVSLQENEDNIQLWLKLQDEYQCFGIENYQGVSENEYSKSVFLLKHKLVNDRNIYYLSKRIHRGCSKQILYILERYNLLSKFIALIHLAILVIMLSICIIFSIYFTGIYRICSVSKRNVAPIT